MNKQDVRKIKHYDIIQQMCLMDDELMEACFAGHNECVELVIRVILGRDDLIVKKSEIQKTIKGMRRSVRLDIFAIDSEGKRYNIEFQRLDSGGNAKRARYNASIIDVSSLKPGHDFAELPEVYVIFITEHDVLGEGLPLYTIDRVVKESGRPFGDGSHIVYVNCEHYDIDTPLGKLVHDFLCRNSKDEYYYDALRERIKYIKDEPEEVNEVSLFVEEYVKKYLHEHPEEYVKEYVEGSVAKAKKEAAEKAKKEQQKFTAEKMIEAGKLAMKEIAEYSGLSLSTVRRLAKKLEASR